MQTVLLELFNLRETCSVSDRTIHFMVALTRNLVEYTRAREADGVLVSLGQAMAFDRAEHKFLFRMLAVFGLFPKAILSVLVPLQRRAKRIVFRRIPGRTFPGHAGRSPGVPFLPHSCSGSA